jgi:O-antigen ligase
MRVLKPFLSVKSAVVQAISNRNWKSFCEIRSLSRGIPVLLGLGLGPLLALLIVNGDWAFVFALLMLVPLVILFNAYPFASVIIWLLVFPFFASSPTAAGRYMYWIIHRAMIPVGLGIVILSRLMKVKKYHMVRLGRAELAMGAFAGCILVSILLFQPNTRVWLINSYDRILVPFAMYLLMRLTTPRKKEMERLSVVAFIVAVSQSVIGLLSWFAPQVLPPQWLHLQGVRTVGTLRQPAVYTSALIFSIALLFQAAMNRKAGWLRTVYLSGFGLGAVCVFLSFSRGSWVGGVLVAAGLLILFPKPMIRMSIILLAIMAVLASGALSSQMAWASERLETQDTIKSRVAISEALIAMNQRKPFFGWGYGNQKRYSAQFLKRAGAGYASLSSHNTYLTIAAEMGLAGLFLYIFPFVWWLILSVKVLSRIPKDGMWDRSLLVVFWLVIVNYIIVSNFIDIRYFPFGLTLSWMTLGCVANVVYPYLDLGDTGTRAGLAR